MALSANEYRVWVSGRPRSQTGKGKFHRAYVAGIQTAARAVFKTPLQTDGIEVTIVFVDQPGGRPDVDNVPKLVIDALKGIAFHDDRQVHFSGSGVLSRDDAWRFAPDGTPHNTFSRLLDDNAFLIRIIVPSTPSIWRHLETS